MSRADQWIRVGEDKGKARVAKLSKAVEGEFAYLWGPHVDLYHELKPEEGQMILAGVEKAWTEFAAILKPVDKDGLLDLVFDRVIGEQPVPDPDPERWQEQVREVARTMRRTILGHRDVVRLSIGRIPLGPNALRYADRVLGILRAGGLPDDLALAGQQLLMSVVIGFAIDETGEGGQPPADRPPPGTEGAMVRDYLGSLPGEQFPNLVAVADHMAAPDPDARFELLLDFFVDGLAQRAI